MCNCVHCTQYSIEQFFHLILQTVVTAVASLGLSVSADRTNKVLPLPSDISLAMVGGRGLNVKHYDCLQCFDAVGWTAGRASGL